LPLRPPAAFIGTTVISTVEAATGIIHTNIMIAILEAITGIMIVITNVGGKTANMGTDGGVGDGEALEGGAIFSDTLTPTLISPNRTKKPTSYHTQHMCGMPTSKEAILGTHSFEKYERVWHF
jgi:hypothetical protein